MSSAITFLLGATPVEWVQSHMNWVLFGGIIVLGLLVFGLRDVGRFSFKRMWAISSVCFSESLRRRVLWITPLVMIGVLIVVQFTRPLDEMDAVRITTKYCLFATGLLLIISLIILASTNLPREIDNKVIYTIVTKPTTRLEVVLGKVVGFARVSLLIILIMGGFTYLYLRVQAFRLERQLTARLEQDLVSDTSRGTLEHYRDHGLLTAQTLQTPNTVDIISRIPEQAGRLWVHPEGEQEIYAPFDLDGPTALAPPDAPEEGPGATGMYVEANVKYRRTGEPLEAPQQVPYIGNYYDQVPPDPPAAQFGLATQDFFIIDSGLGGGPVTLTDPNGNRPIRIFLPPDKVAGLARFERLYIKMAGLTPLYEFALDPESIRLIIPPVNEGEEPKVIPVSPLRQSSDVPSLMARGREGRQGEQLRGGGVETFPPIAVYGFDDANIRGKPGQGVPMEIRVGVERTGGDPEEAPTELEFRVYDRTKDTLSEVTKVKVEAQRTSFFSLPYEPMASGDFDIRVVNTTRGHYLNLIPTSLAVVQSQQSFAWNLALSLLTLWLLSILVVTIAICCSTFLSWPIAVVLTLVILFGHWGVSQLGDSLDPGLGRRFVTEAGVVDPSKAQAVSVTVDHLARTTSTLSKFLPDLTQYAATDYIERGITMPLDQLGRAAMVTFGFGLPLVVLAYVFLKKKEVAP